MIALEEDTYLLERVITTLEMLNFFGDDMKDRERLIVKTMQQVTEAQEIVESHLKD